MAGERKVRGRATNTLSRGNYMIKVVVGGLLACSLLLLFWRPAVEEDIFTGTAGPSTTSAPTVAVVARLGRQSAPAFDELKARLVAQQIAVDEAAAAAEKARQEIVQSMVDRNVPRRVAYAVTVTELQERGGFVDGLSCLSKSIHKVCAKSVYLCDKVAFVHSAISQEAKDRVERMGWRPIVKDVPVAVKDIKNAYYVKNLVKSGCCGELELLKLWSYTLTEYDKVVHLDADTLLLQPLDDLFASNSSLQYTSDNAMMKKKGRAKPVQGGFLVITPSMRVFDELVALVQKGDWRVNTGWEGSGIGFFYGGPTIQGLLPFYYTKKRPYWATQIDRCVYNHMAQNDECRDDKYSLDVIKSVHFTDACPKPWQCQRKPGVCGQLQELWMTTRAEVEIEMGITTPVQACKGRSYNSLPPRAM